MAPGTIVMALDTNKKKTKMFQIMFFLEIFLSYKGWAESFKLEPDPYFGDAGAVS
jgi:hypothetical protein